MLNPGLLGHCDLELDRHLFGGIGTKNWTVELTFLVEQKLKPLLKNRFEYKF
jgi:hypothetical protein